MPLLDGRIVRIGAEHLAEFGGCNGQPDQLPVVRLRPFHGLGDRFDHAGEPGLSAVEQGFQLAAAITEPWSNGQTIGQITRLKLVKRQMYGRAKLDLLAARLVALG